MSMTGDVQGRNCVKAGEIGRRQPTKISAACGPLFHVAMFIWAACVWD